MRSCQSQRVDELASGRVRAKVMLGSALLLAWACAKPVDSDRGRRTADEPDDLSGGSGGSSQAGSAGTLAPGGSAGTAQSGSGGSGGKAQNGKGGSSGSTGGSTVAGSGGVTGGTGGSAGGESGKSSTGGTATGGVSPSGGVSATGGGAGTGGDASGGSATAGSANGGTGTAGVPNDPNWMPPDMEAAKIVVLYQAQQTATTSTDVRMVLHLKNQTDAPYDLSDVTVRYWMSSEPAPQTHVYYSSAGLNLTGAPTFVPNMANSYLEFRFRAGGAVPAYVDQNSLNESQIQAAVDTNINNARFDQSDDWSFDPRATMLRSNPRITVYDGDTLIYGCEPSHVCAVLDSEPSGDAGAGGQDAI